jgi:hypothetical protein
MNTKCMPSFALILTGVMGAPALEASELMGAGGAAASGLPVLPVPGYTESQPQITDLVDPENHFTLAVAASGGGGWEF